MAWYNRSACGKLPQIWPPPSGANSYYKHTNISGDQEYRHSFRLAPPNSGMLIHLAGHVRASIHLGSWEQLHSERPDVHIILVLCLQEDFVESYHGSQYFEPYEGDWVISLFYLPHVILSSKGVYQDPKYKWLVALWQDGNYYREGIGAAWLRSRMQRLHEAVDDSREMPEYYTR
jgi:hypothetical protein